LTVDECQQAGIVRSDGPRLLLLAQQLTIQTADEVVRSLDFSLLPLTDY
jgi:hypothetical protein